MSEFKNLTLDVADQIAVLTISRPAALNALNSETLDELNVALTEIEARDDVKVLILTGGPDKKGNEFKSFVAGADIAEMVNFTAPQARAFGIKASEPFFKLMNMRQVTIAAVNGFALGGGCEISMACDIRIASENAIFGQPAEYIVVQFFNCQFFAMFPQYDGVCLRVHGKHAHCFSLAENDFPFFAAPSFPGAGNGRCRYCNDCCCGCRRQYDILHFSGYDDNLAKILQFRLFTPYFWNCLPVLEISINFGLREIHKNTEDKTTSNEI